MGRKGNLAVFESTNISETEEVTPTKIGVDVCYINPYFYEFFEAGIDVTYIHTNFGGRGHSGFGDIGTFKNGQISLSTHGL